eukprot:5520635-Pyramimonas_sp.AAC.1
MERSKRMMESSMIGSIGGSRCRLAMRSAISPGAKRTSDVGCARKPASGCSSKHSMCIMTKNTASCNWKSACDGHEGRSR